MLDFTADASLAFMPNYSEFPNSWVGLQLAFLIKVFEVLVYGWYGYLK